MKSKASVLVALLGGMIFTAPFVLSADHSSVIARQPAGATASVKAGVAPVAEQVIHITARNFEFTPGTITVKKGVPVVLELTSADRKHGFSLRAFGVRADIKPGAVSRVQFTPDRTGRFTFLCDVFCGEGHEDMSGTLVVTE
ncbi:MAG: cytochrome c oxidase subunit [Acidobacteriota bacterium]|jgi:cytochrome c oxidase subunit 2|nr:cytochrome c oxidase subunit [Acidobacteriota bacterium]